jgi:putative nucleotidyltransferase with HDIG domain
LALNILIVDPDEEWLHTASGFFKEQMYAVKAVNNGKDAQLALYNDKFFAVVLNFSVKNHAGSQVLKFIRTNHPSQKVIMVFENDNLLGGEEGIDKWKKLGATEVAVKPFEMGHLSDLLEGHQSLGDLVSSLPKKKGTSDEVEVQEADDDFTGIRIDEFYSSQAVLFDVFVKLGSGRYVKILHAGDVFSKERIDKYKNEKGVEYLYFHKKDRRKYVQFNNFIAKKLINTKNVSGSTRINQLKNVTDKYLEEVYTQGMKPQVIDQGKEVVNNIYNFVEKQDDLHKLLKDFEAFDPKLYEHSFMVSVFATSIIKQFEWQSQITIEATALACLFHDIGKMKLPREILDLRPVEMDDEQMEIYKQHPEFGVELVENNRMINNSVKQIILQHHEAYNGTGYPYGIKSSKILTLANIVCCADDFVHIMIDEELPPSEALKKMLCDREQVAKYNSMIVENFIKVFVDPEKLKDQNKQKVG